MARRQAGPPQLIRGSGCFRNAIRLLALSAALPAFPASAAKWDIIPTLAVAESYTDNVRLTPPGSERSDWVTRVTPGISINATGPRLKFSVNYTPEAYYYVHEEQNNRTEQRLKATGNVELAKQLLFVDAGANIEQVNESLLNPLTDSDVNITDNRATVRSYFVSPYLLRDFGSAFRGEARFTSSKVDTSGASTSGDPESDGNRIDLRLASGPAYKLFTWSLAYNKEKINYNDPTQQDTITEVVTANARRLITPNIGILAMVGYESYDRGIFLAEVEGSKWSAGFDWTPSPRTYVAATVGERFYGDAYSFEFRLRTRLTTWSASYSEDVTSTRSQFFLPATGNTSSLLDTLFQSRIPDPAARQRAVQEFIARTGLSSSLDAPVNFFSSQQFLEKKSQASGGIVGVRNTLLANVFHSTAEALIGSVVLPGTGDFAASSNIKQSGTSAIWNWRATARNTFNTNVGFVRNEFRDLARVDHLTEFGVTFTRQIQPRLTASLGYRWRQDESTEGGIRYRENAVSAGIFMRF